MSTALLLAVALLCCAAQAQAAAIDLLTNTWHLTVSDLPPSPATDAAASNATVTLAASVHFADVATAVIDEAHTLRVAPTAALQGKLSLDATADEEAAVSLQYAFAECGDADAGQLCAAGTFSTRDGAAGTYTWTASSTTTLLQLHYADGRVVTVAGAAEPPASSTTSIQSFLYRFGPSLACFAIIMVLRFLFESFALKREAKKKRQQGWDDNREQIIADAKRRAAADKKKLLKMQRKAGRV
jgi:hypothetical protein